MNPVYAGLIRHLLTALGGALAAKGYIGSGDVELVAGALATIIGVAWSVYEKRKQSS